MLLLLLLLLAITIAAESSPNLRVDGDTCTVLPIGGGQDDAPNIINAFDACRSGGTVVLDQYYVVNTVLVITDLQNVNIQLSGVGQSVPLHHRYYAIHSAHFSTIHAKYRLLVPQLLLYGVPERVCQPPITFPHSHPY